MGLFFTGKVGKFFTKKNMYFEKNMDAIVKPSQATVKKNPIDLTPNCCGEDSSREKCCES